MEETRIEFPALARPSLESLQKDFPDHQILRIKRDVSLERAAFLALGGVFPPDTDVDLDITAEEFESRLRPSVQLTFGYQQAKWLVEQQDGSTKFHEVRDFLRERTFHSRGGYQFESFPQLLFPGLVIMTSDGQFVPAVHISGDTLVSAWYFYSARFWPEDRIALLR